MEEQKGGRALAHVVAVNMGYGHERAAFALRHLALNHEVIVANDYEGITDREKRLWNVGKGFYEFVSRFKHVPVLGTAAFGAMDKMQRIPEFYPRRDLSKPSLQVKQTYGLIHRQGICQDLIHRLAKRPLPIVSTFFTPAFAAEEFNYPEDIYIVLCDADVSRAWVPLSPKKSRIKFIAPTGRVAERLHLYGVKSKNIFLTGFPIPYETVGGAHRPSYVRADLRRRMCNLDPDGNFVAKAHAFLDVTFGQQFCAQKATPPSLTFAVGGAGTQRELVALGLRSLAADIRAGRIIVNLVAGTRPEVCEFFEREIRLSGLVSARKAGKVTILFEDNRPKYFEAFSKLMRSTDILWTKPSELSFYTGLGIPILMAPTVGSQEEFNRAWLLYVGGGADALNPKYMNEWLFDWIKSGALGRMAWNGFVNAPTHGAYRVESLLRGDSEVWRDLPLVV
ncbi:MAG: hypothetical protein WCT28_03775 [Patescibacteria group bacterium]|jgi:hypothetical protein